MIRKAGQSDQKPGWMLILSLLLHMVIILLYSRAGLIKYELHETTPYYVDIVSLPVAEPAAGTALSVPLPAPATRAPAPAYPPPATPPSGPAMALPSKSAAATTQNSPATAQSAPPDSDREAREFRERLSRLEHRVEAKHQAAALESLQKKAATNARAGAPAASGATPGYDYAAYIQSRLKDALATTIVYSSKQPETYVHIYIDKRGKLLRYVVEKASGDKLFNDSVIRAIEKAKSNFPPTTGGSDFDKLYVFSPQEVSKK